MDSKTNSQPPNSRDLVLLAVALFIWGLGEGAFAAFQPLYLQQLGADALQIGAFLGSVGATMMLVHLPAGYLADRFGPRSLMWASWVLGAVATWIMALASGLAPFVAGMLVYAFSGFVIAPMNSYITGARGRWSVARALTLISATYNLGIIIGPLLGGSIGQTYGLKVIFFFSATIFILSTVIVLFIRPQPAASSQPGRQLAFTFQNRRFLGYLGVVFLAVFSTYLSQPLSPNYLSNQQGLSLSLIGMLTAMTGLGAVVLNLVLGQLPARHGFLLAQFAVGIFTILLWRGTGLPWFATGYFLLGGYKIARSLATAQIRSLTSVDQVGLAYGANETVMAAAVFLAPMLAGYLYSRQPTWIYSFSAVAIVLSLLVSARFSPAEIPANEPTLTIEEERPW